MARARLYIVRGDTLTTTVDWDQSGGSPVNLTGYTVTCSISVGDLTYALTEGDGLTVDDLNGRATVTLTRQETAEFTEQFGAWRLYVVSGSDEGTTLAEGLVFVSFSGVYDG